ncbi:PREDICTED: coiled-coil domain-containing protein 6 [Phaethon lepturus]|uniref:coiled-coil domain-containing protein 6 n=1 Tax=Phaethon lepturus TaxID=97097 RepID=UPI000530456C|nr:PREDICTED: coiled-coil domain-containing protein 6 [Phaethon lepturus]
MASVTLGCWFLWACREFSLSGSDFGRARWQGAPGQGAAVRRRGLRVAVFYSAKCIPYAVEADVIVLSFAFEPVERKPVSDAPALPGVVRQFGKRIQERKMGGGRERISFWVPSPACAGLLPDCQARAEQEEEFISNTLFKKIQALQKEKETLAVNYEKEEEFLTNELSRKLMQLQHEKAELEQHLEQEQEFQVNKLMKKIKKLENDTISKQLTLEQLRREKIDLENTLEQEQEALVNRLWKRMDKLEAEKRILQEKLDQPVSAPPSPRDISMEIDSPENMMRHIRFLKNEVERLKKQLRAAQLQHSEKMAQYLEEERHMREENLRLQRKLQREMERREALCRQLSESESSLEMDDERYFNEMSAQGLRPRTVSSPIPYTPSPSSSRPISPGLSYASHTVGFTPPTSLTRAGMSYYNSPGLHVQHMGPSHGITRPSPRRSNSPDKFKRPTPPPSPNTQTPVQPPPPPPPPPVQPTVQSAASQSATFQHSVHPSSQP